MSLLNSKNTVHVEVCLKQTEQRLDILTKNLEPLLYNYIKEHAPLSYNVTHKLKPNEVESELKLVASILLEVDSFDNEQLLKSLVADESCNYQFRFYVPNRRPMELEMLEGGNASSDNTELPSSKHWLLPSCVFQGLWENLIYENGLKEKLLKFAISALILSQQKVNTNIISCNRLLLLHGPPGTGKTSLCKALAQKLAIRARCCYRYAHLIEINSHSLFSKWFSESGKLVMRLFAKIYEIIQDENNLVCVLIDEVESLAYARNAMSGHEPQDAMRVVNALLTQLDGIKQYANVLVLATSNLADVIDLAFVDRADIKQYIGLPSVPAIRQIYESMFLELMRVGILKRESLYDLDGATGDYLQNLVDRSIGLSGRALRKLPFFAHAVSTNSDYLENLEQLSLRNFLEAMLMALEKHLDDEYSMNQKEK